MANEEIVRLNANDYEELIYVLNTVFSEHNGHKSDFEASLPKMCKADDEHMSKHIAIKKDGSIRAVLGVYPLPCHVAGEDLMFSTMGNVATLKSDTGKGYMSILLSEAMKELTSIGADASRLGGKRSRYARYNFEICGSIYNFELNSFDAFASKIPYDELTFKRIEKDDSNLLRQAMALHSSGDFYVKRPTEKIYHDSARAWKNIPYAALDKDGNAAAVFSASADNESFAEIFAVSDMAYRNTVFSWLKNVSPHLKLQSMPHEISCTGFLSKICSEYNIISPCQFKIINWDRVAYAFLKLKSGYMKLPDYEFTLGIEDYGNIYLSSCQNRVSCSKTDKNADMTLSANDAARYLFGALTPENIYRENPLLPLPLSWNLQDRV